MKGTLYFLSGPTAVGKTELSLRWAETREFPVEILSCDSLQVYRGMDIGTAKPSVETRRRVPHHGIDLLEAHEPFSIAAYVEYARKTVEALTAAGRAVLVTGGSGFYLKSFFAPVLDPVEIPKPVTRSVRALYHEQGLGAMVARIKALNPGGVGDLEVANPRRVMRALERCLASRKQLPELQAAFRNQPTPYAEYRKRTSLLDRTREDLEKRIANRTRTMLEAGLVEEVERLLANGFEANPSATRSVGYRECLDWMKNDGSDREALEVGINRATWRLVKKQRSWFRNQIEAERMHLLEPKKPDPVEDLFG